ncbi:serine hydrolase [Streptomyces sp. NPDC005262]|uniref:serine hydrolase n=1 Tax=Streptomyces sp. NPDC005262 TaxID=3364710 RepID=UPI0036A33A9E
MLRSSAPPLDRHGHDPAAFVEIGSLTKVLTGTVLVRMARAGLLGLDDPVEQWLPTSPGSGITLRHLTDHTSGLPRLPPGLRWPGAPVSTAFVPGGAGQSRSGASSPSVRR